jgi:biotin operon repressor
MQDDPSARWPAAVARADTPQHEHQRRLVLELAVDPPAEGDHPSDLARTLGFSRAAIDAAADGLVAAGLAERRDGRLFATVATRALDALWPIGM